MSLINDALKRLKQTRPRTEAAAAVPEIPLQPVQTETPPRRASVIIIPTGIALIALAGWFIWQWWAGQPHTAQTASSNSTGTNRLVVGAKLITSVKALSTNRAELVASAQAAANSPAKSETQSPQPNLKPTQAVQVVTISPNKAAPEGSAATTNPSSPEVEPVPLGGLTSSKNLNFPPLKLQGIYYRLSKPSALINNKTLYVNDEIDGVRVVAIERHGVKVELGGKTKELGLK